MKELVLIAALICIGVTTHGQEVNHVNAEEYLLEGYRFIYQYQSGSAIYIAFTEKELTYQWIAGKNAGKPAKTYPYKSRKLDTGVYLVNWHEPKLKNYISLVYNFNNNTCASSVIVNYDQSEPFLAFEGGIIEHVRKK